ncbi:MAG TPA: vitamin B12 dependent-methionine synthase activation domain-containing protein [Clostridia bacterium]|jgi:hypothetical protein|nr:MAG: Vitamin B12 dependent methionine synthase, activation domain [Firmicutes bacterium ADurb.Bin146]HOD92599.1 vitamin B12 dependent-methionine synthase activation domain-containing protein [Clostridia bacterium]HQM39961.1 vitamin B12 dependent-methionine synthase activation domain-containing protein [Clostridia bacterium]
MVFKLKKEELTINKQAIIEKLRISEDDIDEFNEIYEKCINIACPKYLFAKKEITAIDEDSVQIEGITIKSRIASKNMRNTGYAYPYVVTCGHEIYEFAHSISDPFVSYWIDHIMEQLLYLTMVKMKQHMKASYNLGKTATVNPGSTVDWPISGQSQLFALLSDEIKDTGIILTPSFLMLPNKSASGVVFVTEEDYMNCQDCKRKNCPNRRKEYIQSADDK